MSLEIVKEYACSRSNLNSFLNLKSFLRLFPSGISEILIEALYEALDAQRRIRTNDISDYILRDFDVPIDNGIIDESLQVSKIDFVPFTDLIQKLVELAECIEPKITELEMHSAEIITDIKYKIELFDLTLQNLAMASDESSSSFDSHLTSIAYECQDKIMNK
jgi:hypothetical protein